MNYTVYKRGLTKLKNKKGQFYFLAIILLAAVFVGVVTLKNSLVYPHVTNVVYEKSELNTEISYLFDYFSHNPFVNKNTILTNFSNSYIDKIGKGKDSFFMFGNGTSLTLVGSRVKGTSVSINPGSGNQSILDVGKFQKSYTLSGSNFNVTLDGITYDYTFYDGENIYYLIKYVYNNQTFVING